MMPWLGVLPAACLLSSSSRLMSLRVLVLGQLPAGVSSQLSALFSSMDLTQVGHAIDHPSALAALQPTPLTPLPDIALIGSLGGSTTAFDLLRRLTPAQRPAALVFIGEKEEEAVAAFDLQATDFVLWPAERSRVEEALTRARQLVLQRSLLRTADELQRLIGEASALGGVEPSVARDDVQPEGRRRRPFGGAATGTLVASAPWRGGKGPKGGEGRAIGARDGADESVLDLTREDGGRAGGSAPPLRVLVREGRRTRFVPLAEVDWFEADGNYIRVHAAKEQYRTRGTITAIENALDPRQFVRIHRRIVVNMDRVREMSPLPGGDGLLVLGDGSTLRLSRTYRARVR
jgi:two-component system LytT family response regulator